MQVVGIDTETELMGPGRMAPPLVCYSTSIPRLALRRWDDKEELFELIEDCAKGKIKLIGHNIAYDMSVLMAQYPELTPVIFAAYSEGYIEDTGIREVILMLEATGRGHRVSLDTLVRKYRIGELDKGEDSWRLRYAKLREVPIDQWPERARSYAITDATCLVPIYNAQNEAARHSDTFAPSPRRARHMFAAQLMTVWGIKTDVEYVESAIDKFKLHRESLVEYFRGEFADVEVTGKNTGRKIVQRRQVMRKNKESFDTAALAARIEELSGSALPLTDKGYSSLATDALEPLGIALADAYIEYKTDGRMMNTWLEKYRSGIVHCSANPLNNGRISLSKPSMQNLPRKGGIRECFIPRRGRLFASVDFGGIELRTLGQACKDNLGRSTLADIFSGDRAADVPTMFSATILGVSVEDAFAMKAAGDPKQKKARQDGKVALYGLPGGMGDKVFQSNQRRQGNDFTLEQIAKLREAWLRFLPEMRNYFKYISNYFPEFGSTTTWRDPRSGHRRSNLNYTTLANAHFSTPMAYGSNDAMFEVAKKQYSDPSNVLYGTRTVICVHDELDVEVDEAGAHEQTMEIERIMCEEMRKMTPDVPIAVESALMRRWSKGAEPVFDSNGRLVPWEDKKE